MIKGISFAWRYTWLVLTIPYFSYASSDVGYARSQSNATKAIKVSEYVYTNDEDEKVHLSSFAASLRRYPKARAYVIGYGDPFYRYGDVNALQRAGYARLTLVYLVGSSIGWDRVVTVDGGFREKETVELYIVPPGAPPPRPTPTIPTSDVTFCPLVTAGAPIYIWRIDKLLTFSASVRYVNQNVTPTYQWAVSEGTIIRGQGTPQIEVALPEGNYRSITATLEVGGFSPKCLAKDFATSPTAMWVMPHEFDEYPAVPCEDEMARLDNYANYLQADPEMRAHIIVYGARRGDRRGEVRKRITRIGDYLIRVRGVAQNKVTVIHGGYREHMAIELWLKPESRNAPVAVPTVQPKDVKFRKGRIKKWEYNCDHLGA